MQQNSVEHETFNINDIVFTSYMLSLHSDELLRANYFHGKDVLCLFLCSTYNSSVQTEDSLIDSAHRAFSTTSSLLNSTVKYFNGCFHFSLLLQQQTSTLEHHYIPYRNGYIPEMRKMERKNLRKIRGKKRSSLKLLPMRRKLFSLVLLSLVLSRFDCLHYKANIVYKDGLK